MISLHFKPPCIKGKGFTVLKDGDSSKLTVDVERLKFRGLKK